MGAVGGADMRVTSVALGALQEASEAVLTELMAGSQCIAILGSKTTVSDTHMKAAWRIIESGSHFPVDALHGLIDAERTKRGLKPAAHLAARTVAPATATVADAAIMADTDTDNDDDDDDGDDDGDDNVDGSGDDDDSDTGLM
jgi:hypothetical protein